MPPKPVLASTQAKMATQDNGLESVLSEFGLNSREELASMFKEYKHLKNSEYNSLVQTHSLQGGEQQQGASSGGAIQAVQSAKSEGSKLARFAKAPTVFTDARDTDPHYWIRQTGYYWDLVEIGEKDKVKFTLSYLAGAASEWAVDHKEDSWDLFQKEFVRRFNPLEGSWLVQTEILSIKFDYKVGLETYVNTLKALFNRSSDVSKTSKLAYFCQGLPMEVQQLLIQHRVSDLESAIVAVNSILATRKLTSATTQPNRLLQMGAQADPCPEEKTMTTDQKLEALLVLMNGKSQRKPRRRFGPCTICQGKFHSAEYCWDNPKNSGLGKSNHSKK